MLPEVEAVPLRIDLNNGLALSPILKGVRRLLSRLTLGSLTLVHVNAFVLVFQFHSNTKNNIIILYLKK